MSEPLINSTKLIISFQLISLVPLSRKILLFSSSSFIFTLILINRQRKSPYILQLASDRALASRALLLGTAASCTGVGILIGLIGTLMGVDSFKAFALKTDKFFVDHGIKRQLHKANENNEDDETIIF